MTHFGKTALAVGVAIIVASPAWSQQLGSHEWVGDTGIKLLANKGVQKELKLTADQAKKLDTLAAEFRDKTHPEREKVRGAAPKERHEKMRELAHAHHLAVMKSLEEILTADQATRFEQIVHQQPESLAMHSFQEKLKLTGDQKNKLVQIEAELRAGVHEAHQGSQTDRDGAAKKIAALHTKTSEKIHALFSDEQRRAWKELTGELFDLD